MSEKIATEKYELKIENTVGGVSVFGTPIETQSKSTSFSIIGNKVLLQSILYSFLPASPCVLSGYTFVSGVGSIMATSICTKGSNVKVLREKDEGQCVGGFTLTATPFTPMVCNCKLSIDKAGQDKVKSK